MICCCATELGRLSEAEQYLSQVQWLVLQSQASPPSLIATLHRNLGQLAAARGKLTEARRHFAEDVRTHTTQTFIVYIYMYIVYTYCNTATGVVGVPEQCGSWN